MEVFPEAKCIFYKRKNEDDWFKSMKKQYDQMSILSPLPDTPLYYIRTLLNPTLNHLGEFGDRCMELQFNYPGRPRRSWGLKWMEINETLTRLNYRKHNIYFIDQCPTDKRLIL